MCAYIELVCIETTVYIHNFRHYHIALFNCSGSKNQYM